MKIIPITDLHTPELEIYNERREVQLLRYYEPAPGLFIAESANVILRALATGYEPLSILMEQREADSRREEKSWGGSWRYRRKFLLMCHLTRCYPKSQASSWRVACSVPCDGELCRRWRNCAGVPDASLSWKMW